MSDAGGGAVLDRYALQRWGEPIALEVARVEMPREGSFLDGPGPDIDDERYEHDVFRVAWQVPLF